MFSRRMHNHRWSLLPCPKKAPFAPCIEYLGGSKVWLISCLSSLIISSWAPLSVLLHSYAALGLGCTPLGIGLFGRPGLSSTCAVRVGGVRCNFFDSLWRFTLDCLGLISLLHLVQRRMKVAHFALQFFFIAPGFLAISTCFAIWISFDGSRLLFLL